MCPKFLIILGILGPTISLKNVPSNVDKTLSIQDSALFNGGTFMGDKNKKKLTKKELKAQNHAKLMANKGQGTPSNSNVVDINAFRDQKKDKAA